MLLRIIGRIIEAYLANARLTYNYVKQVQTLNLARSAEDFSTGKTKERIKILKNFKIYQKGEVVLGQ